MLAVVHKGGILQVLLCKPNPKKHLFFSWHGAVELRLNMVDVFG